MPDQLIEFAQGEYDYLRGRERADFFLALAPYLNALHGKRSLRKIIGKLEREAREALERFVAEQNELIEEAKAIRGNLAERAPEIDNSGIQQPDPASHERARYDLDSFAKFDRLAAEDAALRIGYPVVPGDHDNPGSVSNLLGILRGRFRAAEYGEDAGIQAEQIRKDLGDLARRISNLGERHRASLQRYQQESRTLPGLAYGRLGYFGSDLVADPVTIEDDADFEQMLDRSLREWGQPKTLARDLVNGDRLEDWEERSVVETESMLKGESERLQRELRRRLEGRRDVGAFIGRHTAAIVVSVVATVVAALLIFYVFGIGGTGDTTPTPTTTGSTTTTTP